MREMILSILVFASQVREWTALVEIVLKFAFWHLKSKRKSGAAHRG